MTGLNIKTISEVNNNLFDFNYLKVILVIGVYLFDYLFQTKENFINILTPLMILAVIDTLTGYVYAIKSKELSSEKYSKVMVKAFSYCSYVLLARVLDAEIGAFNIMGYNLPSDWATLAFKAMIISTESLSILENISKLGFPVPKKVKALLEEFTDEGELKNKKE